jgi:hypothetical protein
VLSELPATVPVALTMIALEARRWYTGEATPPWRWRPSWARAGGVPDAPQWGVSPPLEAGGRDSSANEVIASWPRAAPSSTSVASSADRE